MSLQKGKKENSPNGFMSFPFAAELTSACCDGVYKPSFEVLTCLSHISSLCPKINITVPKWLVSFSKSNLMHQSYCWAFFWLRSLYFWLKKLLPDF
jgi:hypothetical protein